MKEIVIQEAGVNRVCLLLPLEDVVDIYRF